MEIVRKREEVFAKYICGGLGMTTHVWTNLDMTVPLKLLGRTDKLNLPYLLLN